MAAGKSGGSAGGVFLKGTLESALGVENSPTPGCPPPPGRDTQPRALGGLGAAGARAVDGPQGTRCKRADFGSVRAKARAGRREAARW